jgi:hypothetical protein
MIIDREQRYQDMAMRGKYWRLYADLRGLRSQGWNVSVAEMEAILGFQIPVSARLHRPWWANQSRGNGHSHAQAWTTAGWETARVDMEAETLLFERKIPTPGRRAVLDEFWPVHSAGAWSLDLSLRREDIYDERIQPERCSSIPKCW